MTFKRSVELFGGPRDGARLDVDGWPIVIEMPILGYPNACYRMDLTNEARYQIQPEESE